jgi:hypothetical protein
LKQLIMIKVARRQSNRYLPQQMRCWKFNQDVLMTQQKDEIEDSANA